MKEVFLLMKRPVVGITCNYDYRDAVGMVSGMGITGQDWNFVSGDYIYALETAGALPVMLPIYRIDMEELKPLLDSLDGVLITGGHDVGPEQYGMTAKGYCGTIMPMRDKQDIAIARYFMEERKRPILGICRGVQIMNVAVGGSLYQDLEKEGGFEHHFGDQYPRNTAWHGLKIAEGTALERIYGANALKVNSFHHQALKTPGRNAVITAWSDDGVPEGLELADHPFALGVQWHPEMMFDSEEQMKLVKAFVEACR